MRKFALVLGTMLVGFLAAAEETVHRFGQFAVALDADNAFLPTSLRWVRREGELELLEPRQGVNLSFTDFEYRCKYYREENKHTWGAAKEPRFTVEPTQVVAPKPVSREGFRGLEVGYTASFAKVKRRLLFHEQRARLRLEYDFETTRELVIHEPWMFGATIRFAPGFSAKSVPDGREGADGVLAAKDVRKPDFSLKLLNAGPALLGHPEKKVSILASGEVTGHPPSRMWRLPAGARFALAIELECLAEVAAKLAPALREKARGQQKAFLLVSTAQALRHNKDVAAAEQALLRAAALDPEFATPYSMLAGMRRDTKTPGALTQAEAWVEAAYRMPYNYGYILSGRGFAKDKRLTEAQRRQAALNMLIAVENTVFYPSYYIWAAQPFEDMQMYAQALAMYRQALWALDHAPRSEGHRQKHRQKFEAKIAALEKKLLAQPSPSLPPLIPVRPAKD